MIHHADIPISDEAPNPTTTFVGFSLRSTHEGTYTIKATVNGNEMSKVVVVPTCINTIKPIAKSGLDQSVQSGDLVQLDGSQSYNPNNNPIIYSWTQTSGPDVELNDPTAKNPTFTAPQTTEEENIVYQLTVTNEEGKIRDLDSVTIAVSPASTPSTSSPENDIQKLFG